MATDRRGFLKTTAVTGGAVALGLGGAAWSPATAAGPVAGPGRAPAPKRILILGGTDFIGPHEVAYARERGHTLTLFNRGVSAPEMFPGVEQLRGDRNDDLEALKGREWDVVIDNHARVPRWVREAAELLKDSVGQYVFISTISVYGDNSVAWMDEDAPVATTDTPDAEPSTGALYGPLKALAEKEAERAFPGRTTVIRPGLIVGPGDPTDRFTYWPVRIDRGGDVLVPGDGSDGAQIIDVRDLTRFIVHTAEEGIMGTYNATGPESPLSFAGMVHGIRAVTTGPIEFVWVDWPFLQERGLRPWSDLPVWVPPVPENAAFMRVSIERALARGLTFRPLAETAADTLAWHATRPAEARARLSTGPPPEREAELIREWRARTGSRGR